MPEQRVAVVGAGIIGLALARHLTQTSGAEVTVLEKESAVGVHQTGHNSGVVHAGVYYAPGSLKARLCRRGVSLLRSYCAERSLPYEECGKVIVARNEDEVTTLRGLRDRAQINGVPGLRWLSGRELTTVEPHVAGVAALHSPSTAITDFRAVAESLAGDVVAAGGALRLGTEVSGLTAAGDRARLRAGEVSLWFDRVVICAGLYSDRLARGAGDTADPMIIPFRGEYLQLVPERTGLIRGLVYPVPDPRYPFLGVHFTRRLDGGVDIGPNAVLALAREGYRWRSVSARDLGQTLRFGGFYRMAARHWRTGLREITGSLYRRRYVAEARAFVPSLTDTDVISGGAGVRAQAVDRSGTLVDDFRISQLGPIVAIRNAPSPGATSSLAIAEYIAAQMG
ncbi:MAG TPA: L-2-hydroxyglutarate oxidase [Solirubrobacteraceae bacterium]